MFLPVAIVCVVAKAVMMRMLPDNLKSSSITPVSAVWAERFLRRHGLSKVKSKPLDLRTEGLEELSEPRMISMVNSQAWGDMNDRVTHGHLSLYRNVQPATSPPSSKTIVHLTTSYALVS